MGILGFITISLKTGWRDIQVSAVEETCFAVVGYDSENLRLGKFDGKTGEKLQDVEIGDANSMTDVKMANHLCLALCYR